MQRGVALVFVLWAGALVSVILVGVTLTTGARLAASAGTVDRLQAELLADAGIRAAMAGILDNTMLRDGRAPPRFSLDLEGAHVSVEAASEYGRVDVNTAAEPLVRGLADVVTGGAGEALAEAWLARRAGEDVVREPGAGDGAPQVSAGSFIVQRELLDLPGVDRAVYARLQQATTVHARQVGIDPLAAPRDVLLALPGATPALVDEFIAERDAAGALDTGADAGRLLAGLRARLPQALTLLAVRRPAVFTIRSVARLPNGAVHARLATFSLRRTPERPYSILQWTDDPRGGDVVDAPDGAGAA